MYRSTFGRAALLGLVAIAMVAGACKHEPVRTPPPTTQTTPPQTAPPARPTVTLQASTTIVQKGESATLNWSSTNATSLTLVPSVGTVAPEGSAKVSPTESTTYTITATGPGGKADATVRITVGAAAVEQPPPSRSETVDEMFLREVKDPHFDYNKFDLRPDARDALSQTAQFLRTHPDIKVVIEGHCDERGTTEYNLGLGQNRAEATKKFLVSLGIAESRLSTTSFGKEKPACNEHNEECWQMNRRAHIVRAQ
jgi:peptidoglycan-associated lipoprotein